MKSCSELQHLKYHLVGTTEPCEKKALFAQIRSLMHKKYQILSARSKISRLVKLFCVNSLTYNFYSSGA